MTTFCVISYLKISAVFKWFTYTYEKFFNLFGCFIYFLLYFCRIKYCLTKVAFVT